MQHRVWRSGSRSVLQALSAVANATESAAAAACPGASAARELLITSTSVQVPTPNPSSLPFPLAASWASTIHAATSAQQQQQHRAFSAGAVKAAQPPVPIIAVSADVADGAGAADDPYAHMTPKAVVELLDRYIIGQDDAKRAVAVAYRNRWRRKRVPAAIRDDIVPKNILLIGPTGCGKTEIARRLAKLANSPFVKVEATKFTEVGYHGRDVDTIIRDLLEAAISLVRSRLRKQHEQALKAAVEERLLRALSQQETLGAAAAATSAAGGALLEGLRERLRKGELEDVFIEVDLTPSANGGSGRGGMGGGGGGGIIDLSGLGGGMGGGGQGPMIINLQALTAGRRDVRTLRVREARPLLEDSEAERMFPPEQLVKEAITATEQDGIVFIDEIDKIVSGGRGERSWRSGDPSSEGVQRDLLPIIEGSTVSTKHGNVNTDHVLFICAGAFHSVKPSDLMAELQGRLPIRVELKPLTRQDFLRIFTEPEYNLIKQQQVLLAAEGVDLEFTQEALEEMTRVAEEVNRSVDNIGARRLHAVLERVVEEVSFSAPELVAAARREAATEAARKAAVAAEAAVAAAAAAEAAAQEAMAAAREAEAAAAGTQLRQDAEAAGARAGTAEAGGDGEAEAGSEAVEGAAGRGASEGGRKGGEAGTPGEAAGGAAPARVRYVIDKAHVERSLSSLLQKQDLTRYIL